MSQIHTIKQIGNYQYNDRHCCGEGAYGKVYQGEILKTKETIAIKKLDLVLFERDQYLRNQIVSEIEIIKKFNHPNIVKFIDLITTQRSLYIITEFCKDGDLKELLLKKRLSEQEAIEILFQIIKGFRELVKNGIIHRDLKPANILNNEGVVKIADFGFAKYVDNYSSQLLRSCVGSPLYMAPQILSRKTYSTKCDIWSIGVIFYEMVFHDVPWKGRDEQDLLRNILTKSFVMKNNVSVSKFTEEFLKKTLQVDENDRISWEQIFYMIDMEQSNRKNISVNPMIYEAVEENVQKIPTWMNQAVNKPPPISQDQLEKQLKLAIAQRQELAFRHFVNVEIFNNWEQLKIRPDIQIEEFYGLLAKCIVSCSQSLMNQIKETCEGGENHLQKGTKWNIINQLNKEHEYYQMFYDEVKEYLQRSENSLKIGNWEEFKIYFEGDQIDQKRLDDNLSIKGQKLIYMLNDELWKRSYDKKYIETLRLLDYITDVLVVRKKIEKQLDIDYDQVHSEKIMEDDFYKILDRIKQKQKNM